MLNQSSLGFELLLTMRAGVRPLLRVTLSVSLDLRLAVEQSPALLAGVGLLGVLLHHVDIEVVLGVEDLTTLLTGVLLVSVEILQVMIIARGRLQNCPTNLARPDSCSVLFSLVFPQYVRCLTRITPTPRSQSACWTLHRRLALAWA